MKHYAVAAALVLAVATGIRQAQAVTVGSGLEVADYDNLTALVEPLGPDARAIGLTDSAVQNRLELRLRAAGIKPETVPKVPDFVALEVNVNVVGGAVNIQVSLIRAVTYSAGGRTFGKLATTWQSSIAGTHGRKSAGILDVLDELLDKFLNEYLRANQ